MGLWQHRHIQAGTHRRAHTASGAQRTAERLGQRGQVLLSGVGRLGRLGARVHCTELAADAIELHRDHLPMTDTAGEHIEQDAAIERSSNERAVGTGKFHGAALYRQPPTKCLQKISGGLS